MNNRVPPCRGRSDRWLSIAPDVIAGPLDLGEAVIRAPVAIDPATGAVSITSDPLPTLIDGIPLQLRTFALTIDRPEFLLNSIVCDPGQITATVQGAQGASVQSSTPFTDTGCENPPTPAAVTPGRSEARRETTGPGHTTGDLASQGASVRRSSAAQVQHLGRRLADDRRPRRFTPTPSTSYEPAGTTSRSR